MKIFFASLDFDLCDPVYERGTGLPIEIKSKFKYHGKSQFQFNPKNLLQKLENLFRKKSFPENLKKK